MRNEISYISKSIDVIATDLYLKVTNSCYPNRDFTYYVRKLFKLVPPPNYKRQEN